MYPIKVPSLRERGRDVLLLAGHFLELNRRRLGLRGLRLEPATRDLLLRYDWPGNVRELEHLISRAALKAQATTEPRRLSSIGPAQLDIHLDGEAPAAAPAPSIPLATPGSTLREATDAFQRRMIEEALLRHHGNQAAVARELGVDRSNFSRLLQRLGIASAHAAKRSSR